MLTDTRQTERAWSEGDLADPHAAADKARRVQRMFAAIAPWYDLNNRLHSLGRDQAWRRAAVAAADLRAGDVVLDVACGTGDLSLAFHKAGAARVIGVDFTCEMLTRASAKAPGPAPAYLAGDAMRLPVADASVDVVSIAFGIRNVARSDTALAECRRVLRPSGRLVILEFSLPANRALRRLYNLYFNHVLPRTAGLIAGDRSGAYRYLPRSVNTFLDRSAMLALLRSAGFVDLAIKPLTLGIAVTYRGRTPQ